MKLKDLVTHERGRLNLFRYPTHDIGTYLGRGVLDSFVTWGYDGDGLVIFGGHQVNIGGGL